MRTMASPPTPERIRLSITVTPEVHAIFTRIAEAAGTSLGHAMGDWLEDTSDGAQFVAQKMVEARQAPKTVMREMQAFTKGLMAEVDDLAGQMRRGEWPAEVGSAQPGRRLATAPHPSPPSSNTGGKVPRGNPKKGTRP